MEDGRFFLKIQINGGESGEATTGFNEKGVALLHHIAHESDDVAVRSNKVTGYIINIESHHFQGYFQTKWIETRVKWIPIDD